MKRFVIPLIISSFLTACNCKNSYMPENPIVKAEDKRLNCKQIIYAINETEFWMKNVNERCVQPHVFAKFFPCTPMVKLDAMRNEYTLSDRIDYLRSLYKLKGCDLEIKLKGTSIEKQSSKIGNMIETQNIEQQNYNANTEIRVNNRSVTVNIPSNTK